MANGDDGFFAMPMMRGFPCPVTSPIGKGEIGARPPEGVGFGVSNIVGKGVLFFLSIHGPNEPLVAQLDYARYRRLCELLAAAGKQALMLPGVEQAAANDPLAALGYAHPALADALLAYGDNRVMSKSEAQGCAHAFNDVGAALGRPGFEPAKREPNAAIAMLEECAAQFRLYEQSYLAKHSVCKSSGEVQHGLNDYDKAIVNRDMAEKCEVTIAALKGEG